MMPPAAPAWLCSAEKILGRFRFSAFVVLVCLLALPLRGAEVQLSGQAYLPLSDVAARYGMKLTWVTKDKTVQLKNSYCTIECSVNDRSLTLNDEPLALGAPIIDHAGALYLSKLDFDNNIFPLLSPNQIPGVPTLHHIILDPGHGGKDTGTTNDALKANEKSNTLDVALRLAAILRQRGYEVTLTRSDDNYVELTDRTDIANKAKGDLYISIHFNNAPQKSVTGIETWILPPPGQPPSNISAVRESDKVALPGNRFDLWNTILAYSVERSATRELDATNRGVKREHLVVLKALNMPGMLIECGFLSSPVEAVKILTPDYRQKIATSIADGVDLYKATLDHLRPKAPALPAKPAAPPHNSEAVNEIKAAH
jgi:N-acetylmuramoyl-L-alanine amidase